MNGRSKEDSFEGSGGSESEFELGRRLEYLVGCYRTRKEAANTAGVSPEQLRRYISGETKSPFDVMVKLAGPQNISLDWLASGIEPVYRYTDGPELSLASNEVAERQAEFVRVPRFDIQASAGPGAFSDRENVLDFMAFRAEWIRRDLRVDPSKLVLIRAVGDSMEPAIRAGDLLLIDTGVDQFVDDAIYIVVLDGALLVKRIQRFFGGAVSVKSDNPAYVEQTLSTEEAADVTVAGRVRWIGRLI